MSEFHGEEVFGGVDIGGSHVGVCLINVAYEMIASVEESNTDEEIADSSIMLEKIFRMLRQVMNDVSLQQQKRPVRLAAVGVGCPGQPKDGVLTAASNFPCWSNVPFVEALSGQFSVPATLVNDVDAALAAEYWGQPKLYSNVKHAVMVALGTGVGYSVIIEGKQHLGNFGLLEGGHIIINPFSDVLCGCGQYGCIESYTSAKNTALRYENEFYKLHPCPPQDRIKFNAKDVFDRAKDGDELALKIVDEVSDYLAVFSINISRMIDPEVIIFAGGMANAGDFFLNKIRDHFMRRTWNVLPSDVSLRIAQSCNVAGMVGAAVAARMLLK